MKEVDKTSALREGRGSLEEGLLEEETTVVREPASGGERRIKSFEDLEVWRYCRRLRKELTGLAKQLPPEEKFRLADQIIRAARSTTNNIAEGYGRYSYKDTIHFCRMSRGSLYELIDHLIICHDDGYISNDLLKRYRRNCTRGIQLLNGYIRFLKRQQDQAAHQGGSAT